MISGPEIVECLEAVGVTHVVWVPDSTFGLWDADLRNAKTIRLVGVCREGEAWTIAAGLHLGGARPLVVIQCTGLFESGDALRNALHDYQLPLMAMIGYRSYLSQDALPGDTAAVFTEPILKAWNLDYLFVDEASKKSQIAQHYIDCRAHGKPGIVLLAEGRA